MRKIRLIFNTCFAFFLIPQLSANNEITNRVEQLQQSLPSIVFIDSSLQENTDTESLDIAQYWNNWPNWNNWGNYWNNWNNYWNNY